MSLNNPLMIYDGDCSFCRHLVDRLAKSTKGRVDYKPYQEGLNEFPQLTEKKCETAVQFVDIDGQVYSAAKGVFKALTYTSGWGWLYGCYKKNKSFAKMAEGFYRWIARNRG